MMSVHHVQQSMTLSDLLAGIVDAAVLESCGDLPITSLALDSRSVEQGALFIAVRGMQVHGMDFASDAVTKGAVAVICETGHSCNEQAMRTLCESAVCVPCENLSARVSEIASRFYQHPSQRLNVIGVTGTDGKTSISHYLAQAFGAIGETCGVMGTLGNGFLDALQPTGLTTASAVQVQASLSDIVSEDAKHVVMEVSSHGLEQGRVNDVAFDIALFTNLSHDHLDYHETFEAYAEAKRKLFTMPGLRAAVINLDDDYGRKLAQELRGKLSVWGVSKELKQTSDFTELAVIATSFSADTDGLRIKVQTPKGSAAISVGLLGDFSVTNVLTVLAAMLISGVDFESAIAAIQKIRPVTGRMQLLETNGGAHVVIDYAHTPQAFESACRSLKQHFEGELVCAFGCGGDRDRGKRPLMGKVAEQYCDHIIITNDNPRYEDPDQIIGDIVAGMSADRDRVIEQDRKTAIETAIINASAGDVVLVAGKGHESSQLIGDTHIAFNDIEVARQIIEAQR